MKTRTEARKHVDAHITRHLHTFVAGDDTTPHGWPWAVPLGRPTRDRLETDWATYRDVALDWRRAPLPEGVALDELTRRVHGTTQSIPARLLFATLDAAAAFAGPATTHAVAAARDRWATLDDAFPETASTSVLRAVLTWDSVDVNLLIDAAGWFREHPSIDDAWTPRMVPVPGLHAKWLDQHRRRSLIAHLAGLADMTFLKRPAQLHLTYLDPTWLDSGGRRWDLLTDGDTATLPYRPRAVIVTENRDTAFFFPRLSQAVAAHGDGHAAVRRLAETLPGTPIIYWGDIDAAGLEIVDSLRSRGVSVTTILMDCDTYDQYRQFGAATDAKGVALKPPERRPVPDLTIAERDLYERLTNPAWNGPRRIEQERIPLPTALAAARRALSLG